MTKPVPRSRLNITYRTRIEGRPVKQKLPFRLLVLGDFSGGQAAKLESREVHSILPGMRVDDFMNELAIAAPIDDDHLKSTLVGQLAGAITGEIKKRDEKNKKVTVKLTGTAEVSGARDDNGLGTFKGQVVLSGEATVDDKPKLTLGKQQIEVSGTVSGDICGRVQTKFEFDFKDPIAIGEEDARGRLINENKFKTPVEVTNDQTPVELNIALHGLKAFTPEYVATKVPELRRLMLIRRLLLEARAFISNRFEMREILKKMLRPPDAATAEDDEPELNMDVMKQLREWGIQNYPMLQIDPRSADKSATPGGGGGGNGSSGGKSSGGGGKAASSGKSSPSGDKTTGAGG